MEKASPLPLPPGKKAMKLFSYFPLSVSVLSQLNNIQCRGSATKRKKNNYKYLPNTFSQHFFFLFGVIYSKIIFKQNVRTFGCFNALSRNKRKCSLLKSLFIRFKVWVGISTIIFTGLTSHTAQLSHGRVFYIIFIIHLKYYLLSLFS